MPYTVKFGNRGMRKWLIGIFVMIGCLMNGPVYGAGDNLQAEGTDFDQATGDSSGKRKMVAEADSLPPQVSHLKDSLAIYSNSNNDLGMARSHHQLADWYKKQQNQSNAVAHYVMASTYYEEANQPEKAIKLYHDVSAMFRKKSHYSQALSYAERARDLSERIGDDSLLAVSAFQMGKVYEAIGKHREAEDAYDLALDLFKKYQNTAPLADMYHRMAEIQEELGRTDSSFNLHRRVLEIRDDINDSSGLAESYYHLGQLFAASDDLSKAIEHHKRSAQIFQNVGQYTQAGRAYIEIGELHAKRGYHDRAVDFAEKAMNVAESYNAVDLKVEALKLALDSYAELGNLDRIKMLHGELVELQDSLRELKQQQERLNVTFRNNTEEKLAQMRELKEEREAQQAKLEMQNWFLISAAIALLLLIGILFLLYNRYRYRKRSEKTLFNKNNELEQLNDRLAVLNEEKSELMQTVTHDLKNPLAGIIGLTDIAKMDADSVSKEELLEYIGEIEETAQRMNKMIHKLLEQRDIESGDYNFDMETHEVSDILEKVIDANSSWAREKDIAIEESRDEGVSTIRADEMAVQRVLDNLVSNAIKYTPKGSQVQVKLYRNNGNVRVDVADHGPGIKKEEREKLFAKYSRLSSKPTGDEDSTGLGLYIAKQLTEQMDGKIGCESEVGEGSTFFVEFPYYEE